MTITRKALLLVLVGFGVLAAQTRLAVFEFEPVMTDTGITKVVASLLRDRLSETGTFSVILPPAGERPPTAAAAESIARTLDAEQAVIGSVARVGTGFLISYKLVTTSNGQTLLSDRVKVESESDLDIITERIAEALKTRKPYAATSQAGRFTTTDLKAHEPASSILFTTGYTFPIYHQLGYDPGTMLFTLDAAVTYELPQFMAMAQMGIIRGKQGYQDIHFELLGHKVLSQSDIAPFVGGGFGIHRISLSPSHPLPYKEDDGLALIANGGVMLFRNYYFRIIGGAKATAVFTQDIGPMYTANLNFGVSSAGFGPTGKVRTPAACIYGTLAGFFITGLIVALTT